MTEETKIAFLTKNTVASQKWPGFALLAQVILLTGSRVLQVDR